MRPFILSFVAMVILFATLSVSAQQPGVPAPGSVPATQKVADSGNMSAPPYGFYATYGMMGVVLIGLLLATLRGLRGFSLNDALTEDTGAGVFKPSVSRLIAFLGFVMLISIYLGVGSSVIFRILSGGTVGDLSGLGTFLVGAAALFTPYLANQIKSAVVGVANPGATTSSAVAPSVSNLSPKSVASGSSQTITVTGSGLTGIQSAICTVEDGSESPILPANLNVLNSGALQVNVTMPAPRTPGQTYPSTLTFITSLGVRVGAGTFAVS